MVNLYIFNEAARGSVYGIGTYIKELACALRNTDLAVCVVYLNSDKTERPTIEEENGIRHWYIPAPISHYTSVGAGKTNYYRNLIYLLQLHIKNKEHLVFHLNYNKCAFLAQNLKSTFACRVISVVHYSDWGITLQGNISRFRSILNKQQPDDFETSVLSSVETDKTLYSNVDRIVCLSGYMEKLLRQEYKLDNAKISIVPNGLTDDACILVDQALLRKKWCLTEREKVILFAGRLDDIKGLRYLIGAFREILKEMPDCQLLIAGNGAYDKYIKETKGIGTKVTFLGLLDREELYGLYRIADVGVVPSLYEPFGYVALEMMMHALPMVVTATSGLDELVDDSCGMKVPLKDLPESVEMDIFILAQKILYLLQNPEMAEELGRNARKRYEKHYTSEVMRQNMLYLYHSLYQ